MGDKSLCLLCSHSALQCCCGNMVSQTRAKKLLIRHKFGCWTGFWLTLVSWWQHYEAFTGWSLDVVLDALGVSLSVVFLPEGPSRLQDTDRQRERLSDSAHHPCISASCKTAQFSPDTNANIYVHLSRLIPSVSSETARSVHSALHTQLSYMDVWAQ